MAFTKVLRPAETWRPGWIHLTLTVVQREGSYEAVGTGGSKALKRWKGDGWLISLERYLTRNCSTGTKLGLIFTECFSTLRWFPMQEGRGTGNQIPWKVRAVEHRVAHPEHFNFLLYLGTTWNSHSCWGTCLSTHLNWPAYQIISLPPSWRCGMIFGAIVVLVLRLSGPTNEYNNYHGDHSRYTMSCLG